MYVLRRRTRIEIWAPAKLNLFLEVLGRRPDGYHEIETLMIPVSLHDTLRLTVRDDGRILLTSRSSREIDNAPRPPGTALPLGDDNLVVRALQRLRERAGTSAGMTAELIKRIPLAAGLGGGSSDAAAALVGANQLWRLGLSSKQLSEVAAELGSDVPFFVPGGPAICRGRGEEVEELGPRVRQHFVILQPPFGLSTAAVYGLVDVPAYPRGIDSMRRAWSAGQGHIVARGMFNRLQIAATELSPALRRIQEEFNRLDLLGHQLSGSGSCYFGVCRHAQHARRTASILRGRCAGRVFHVATWGVGQQAA
jgi:4-diphosphocytidyl-2-C-methyl-D-erythritol kinase